MEYVVAGAGDGWAIALLVIASMVEKRGCWEICKRDMVVIGIPLHRKLLLWEGIAGDPNCCWSEFLWETVGTFVLCCGACYLDHVLKKDRH